MPFNKFAALVNDSDHESEEELEQKDAEEEVPVEVVEEVVEVPRHAEDKKKGKKKGGKGAMAAEEKVVEAAPAAAKEPEPTAGYPAPAASKVSSEPAKKKEKLPKEKGKKAAPLAGNKFAALMGGDSSEDEEEDATEKNAPEAALEVKMMSGERLAAINVEPWWKADDVIQQLNAVQDATVVGLLLQGIESSTMWKDMPVEQVQSDGLVVQAILGNTAEEHIKSVHAYALKDDYYKSRLKKMKVKSSAGSVLEESPCLLASKQVLSDALVEEATLHLKKLGDLSHLQLGTLDEPIRTIAGGEGHEGTCWTGGVKYSFGHQKHGFGYQYSYSKSWSGMDRDHWWTHSWGVYKDGAQLWSKHIHTTTH